MRAKKTTEETKKKLLKIPMSDFEKIERLADRFTGGNISMWIKYAAINHVPSPSELTE